MKVAGAAAVAVVLLIALVAAAAGGVASQFLGGGGSSAPSATAVSDIPPDYLLAYMQAAATCPGLDWSVLAAIGKIETDHGRSTLPGVRAGANSAGAEGPMQFEPATFARYANPVPPGGATPPTPYDPLDAIYAAAQLLCADGAAYPKTLDGAIYAYNHAGWYVAEVLTQAATYATAQGIGTGTPPDAAAQQAINYAQGQLGLPYEYAGSGPADGDTGFDCSGLTQAAYAAAGIQLPHNARAQYDTTPHLPPGDPLQPGDLVFFGTSAVTIHHVGIYIGNGKMIDAPHTGADVRIENYRWSDYYAASRPDEEQ